MRIQIPSGALIEYDDAGQGLPLVLIHAFPLTRTMWRPQVLDLQSDYRVLAPDMRGFGGTSAFDGPPSIERMADDVAGLLDALAISAPIVLGGLSMGGYVSLAFAHKYPARLRGLVLADTRAEADSSEARANRDKLIAFAQEHTAAEVLEQILPKMVSTETRDFHPEVVTEIRAIAAAQAVSGIADALRALRDRPDATPWLAEIKVPTLVVVGSDDVVTPPSLADALAAGIPGAERATVSGAGHLASMEKPGPFNAALRLFLSKLLK
jgi:pimeloyl-ACP methyl ester carboxylesterase